MNILSFRKKVEPNLLKLEGVTGVGSRGRKLRVYVEDYNPVELPSKLNRFDVEVFRTGPIVALSLLNAYKTDLYKPLSDVPWLAPRSALDVDRTRPHRPVVGGVSIGHPYVTAGTQGTSLRPIGYNLGLSNNHVLAAGSSKQTPRARIGDPIYQPGPYDGGNPEYTVGTLHSYVPLVEEGMGVVDCAFWKPRPGMLNDEILGVGVPTGIGTARLDEVVQKSGRTTGVTNAPVLDLNATVKVSFGAFEMTFTNQIITDWMADGGDSGSALLRGNLRVVGLLFAGSDYVTVHNHIAPVISSIGKIAPSKLSSFSIMMPTTVGSLLGGII